jgi:hypothetical protein
MKMVYTDRSGSRQIDTVPTEDYLKTSHRAALIPECPGPLFLNAQEEGGPFSPPSLRSGGPPSRVISGRYAKASIMHFHHPVILTSPNRTLTNQTPSANQP